MRKNSVLFFFHFFPFFYFFFLTIIGNLRLSLSNVESPGDTVFNMVFQNLALVQQNSHLKFLQLNRLMRIMLTQNCSCFRVEKGSSQSQLMEVKKKKEEEGQINPITLFFLFLFQGKRVHFFTINIQHISLINAI